MLGINEHTLREHYQIRAVLEGAACAFCCETNADLTGIQNCLDTAAEALAHQDSSHYADLNQSFHSRSGKHPAIQSLIIFSADSTVFHRSPVNGA
ncbi:MAG: FCD domain-containing protein [Clostridium sp.]